MVKTIFSVLLIVGFVAVASAQDLSWRKDIAPVVSMQCGACHGQNAPEYNDWMLLGEEKRKTIGPRMDTYPHFMSYVVWPATGSMMRRLDDGRAGGGGDPDEVHERHAGDSEHDVDDGIQPARGADPDHMDDQRHDGARPHADDDGVAPK